MDNPLLNAPTPIDADSRHLLPPGIAPIVDAIYKHQKQMSPELAAQILRDSEVTAEELQPWADFEHRGSDSYGRKLLYNDRFFEIMVMSWQIGDISAIHDHGYTLWGAVKIFGRAEHAAFQLCDGRLTTLIREVLPEGVVIQVGHELLHQLGNPSKNERFLSLHMYGLYDTSFSLDSVTCDARVVDPTNDEVQRTDGGMFFNIPSNRVKSYDSPPRSDFATFARNSVEILRRLDRSESVDAKYRQTVVDRVSAVGNLQWLLSDSRSFCDESGLVRRAEKWQILFEELRQLADYSDDCHEGEMNPTNRLRSEATKHCHTRRADLLQRVSQLSRIHLAQPGRSTLLFGEWSQDQTCLPDATPCRTLAELSTLAQKSTGGFEQIIALGAALQQIPAKQMQESIRLLARLLQKGGYLIADFVAPDHLRARPALLISADVSSALLEQSQSHYRDGDMELRIKAIFATIKSGRFECCQLAEEILYLPSILRLRHYLRSGGFSEAVALYDALDGQPIRDDDESCRSTRSLFVAQR